jgi:hypothetical protein
MMDGQTTGFELIEPASPEALVPTHELSLWLVAAAVLTLLLLVIVLISRNRKPTTANLMAKRMAAFSAAKSALESITAATCRDAALRSSLILRNYLAVAANDPALFETHEEFIARHDSLQALTPSARAAAEAGFTRLASLKYAPEIPDADPSDVVAESLSLLETLHQGFAK